MKTYFQLITEVKTATRSKPKPFDTTAYDAKQKAKYGSAMAKAAADALAAAKKKAAMSMTRKPFPWTSTFRMSPGWWHPTKQWFTLESGDYYHVTALVKHPERFGIYGSDLDIAAQQDADDMISGFSSRKATAREVLNDIRKGDIDNSPSIMELAYGEGWLKVYGGKFHTGERGGTLDGIDKRSIKAAIKEIEQSMEMENIQDFRIDVTEREAFKHFKLDTKMKRDAYMRS
jgi:nucleoid-associated protein YgaU